MQFHIICSLQYSISIRVDPPSERAKCHSETQEFIICIRCMQTGIQVNITACEIVVYLENNGFFELFYK